MRKKLTNTFFNRSAIKVAPDLLGKFLVRKIGKKEVALMITETEAYHGHEDKASHAHKGQTKRNEIMWREAGHIYIYLVYGMHYMLNIVTAEKDLPSAVLVRGVEGLSGPGKITKALKIIKSLNGNKLGLSSGLWIEDRGVKINKKDIKAIPRIGVAYAGPVWGQKPYRFILVTNNR